MFAPVSKNTAGGRGSPGGIGLLALGGQIDGHSYACALDESIDKGGQDHFAAYAAVLVCTTASATTRMARLTVKPRMKKPISVTLSPSLQFSIECAGTDFQPPGGFHGGD